MYNDVLTLIGEQELFDVETNDISIDKTFREVFCKVKSIGMREFYQANATGFKPDLKFIISDYRDYHNEKMLEYEGVEYDIIRTYRAIDTSLEIVVQRRVIK